MAGEDAHLGFGSAVGIGQETAYGTAVSRTNWLRVVSWGLKRTINRVARPHLGTNGATSMNRRQHYTESDEAGGTLEFLMAYDDSTIMMMIHGLGAVQTAGSGPYTHTVTLAAFPYTVDTNKVALTLEGLLGNSGEAEVFEGCLATRTEISLSVGGVMTCRQEFIAETSGGQAAAGSPTFSSNGEEILHSHGGSITFNSTVDDITEFSVVVDQKLSRRQKLGSTLTQKPQPSDFIEVTGRFVVEYHDDDRHDEFIAGTQGDATITLTGSGNNQLAISIQNMYITDVSESVNTAGAIVQTVEFRAESDGTDEGLELVFTNDNATATAN
jgi:hypothetical protein